MTFAEDLAAAKEKPRERLEVRVQVNGKTYTLRYTQMDGVEYAAETLKHPFRADVALDREYGYNLNSLAQEISPRCAVRVDGDTEIGMSVEEWTDLFSVLDGGGAQAIANTVFTLNQFADAKAVRAAKKVLDGLAKS